MIDDQYLALLSEKYPNRKAAIAEMRPATIFFQNRRRPSLPGSMICIRTLSCC